MTTVKCGRPARNSLHLMMAHDTARSSNSMIAYLDFVSERPGSSLDKGPSVAVLLLQYKSEALMTGVRAKACGLFQVEERDSGGGGEGLLGSGECMVEAR